MIEVHINPYDMQKQEINVGHLKDHNAYKIIFDELEGSNYQLKVKINNSFEQFPITNNEWIITSSYTQKSPITIQVVEVVEDSLIYHGEEITLNLKSSIRNDGQIIEVVPPAYQSKFDELVDLTKQIKTSYEIGEFNGKDGKSAYQIALDNGFVGSEQDWLDSLDYEHSDEFTKLANQVKEDAKISTQAVNTVTEIKKEVENKANEFDTNYQEKLSAFNDNATEKQNAFNQSVTSANDAFDSKVNQVNSDLDNKITSANNVIDEKVTEATNQANEAKKQAQIATDEVAKVPNLIEGKLDKNLGLENKNMVLVTDAEGNVTTQNKEDFEGGGTTDYNSLENKPQINGVELKGNVTSEQLGIIAKNDNFLYDDVAKSLNPNVTDSFLRAVWNLKLYGQSTQGADPSPTNPQEITAISQFDGNIRNSNQLFDDSKVPTKTQRGVTVTNNGDGSFTISGSGQLSANFIAGSGNLVNVLKKYLHPGEIVIKNELVYPYVYLNLKYTLNDVEYFKRLNSISSVPFELTEEIINGLTLFDYGFTAASGKTVTPITIKPVIYQDGDGTWEPFDSNPQEISYIPTNQMYSTQDGSIADYVDVENGVEVYNMSGAVVFDGSDDEAWKLYASQNGFYILLNDMMVGRGQQGFCDKFKVVSSVSLTGIVLGQGNNYLYVTQVNSYATTIEEWRTWLSQNPITVVYQLATPIKIPIDPEQLQTLRALYTYNGVTNFLCNAPVSFTYERSLQIVINNLENAIGQTNANILLNGGNN